jgi:hypothetical protein
VNASSRDVPRAASYSRNRIITPIKFSHPHNKIENLKVDWSRSRRVLLYFQIYVHQITYFMNSRKMLRINLERARGSMIRKLH